ncbi:hypothetical protein Vafri_2765, partial [Volvox africanus]
GTGMHLGIITLEATQTFRSIFKTIIRVTATCALEALYFQYCICYCEDKVSLPYILSPFNMGNCCGCCGDGDEPKKGGQSGYATFSGNVQGGSGGARETEKDREARLLAAERAEQRQKQFEQSAVGKAAYRSVQEVKDSRKAGGGNSSQPTAADWRD